MRSERLRKRAEESLKSGQTIDSEPKKKKSKAEEDEENAETEVKKSKSGRGKSPKKSVAKPEPEEAPEKKAKETSNKGKGKKSSKKEDIEDAPDETAKEESEKDTEKVDKGKEAPEKEEKEESTKETEGAEDSTDAPEKDNGEAPDKEKEESTEQESKKDSEKDTKKDEEEKDAPATKTFPDDFPSLVSHFGTDAKVPLVGLLFSAGWCPDCTPVVPKIASLLSKVDDSSSMIRVLYVSSDTTADEMEKFIESSGGKDVFSTIPFENTDEIKELKLHFKTCAKKEMKDVGVDEVKGGIPTLKIFSAKTAAVVSEDAVADFEKLTPSTAPEEWKKLADGDSASKES